MQRQYASSRWNSRRGGTSGSSRQSGLLGQAGHKPAGQFRLGLEQLEVRMVLSTIVWTNRGQANDNFDALFGAGAPAQSARAVVDAAIDAWNRVVVDFNHAPGVAGPNGFDLELTLAMDPNAANTGCGASTSTVIGADGKPIQGSPIGSASIESGATVWTNQSRRESRK